MKIRHEICVGNNITTDDILTSLGHGPGFKLKADAPDDTVHGAVNISHCDPRTLDVDILQFRDGRREVATADNINAWFVEQGHKLVKIVGNQAYGNTIIDIKITDSDEPPNATHKTTFKRPAAIPTAKALAGKIDAAIVLNGLAV